MYKYAIFIPCYKAESTIAETLMGIQKSLENANLNIPVYIYDDCGGDNSIKVAKESWYLSSPLICNTNEKNLGERETTNKAFEYFRNKYDWVFIIHADDIPYDNWAQVLIDGTKTVNYDNTISVWSSFDSLTHATKKIEKGDNSNNNNYVDGSDENFYHYLSNQISSWHISGCIINVKRFFDIGGFDIKLPQYGDLDFILKALKSKLGHLYIGKCLTAYRLIENSVSDVSYKTNRDIKELLYLEKKYEKYFDKNSSKKLHKRIAFLSLKRIYKSAIKLSLTGVFKNFSILFNSVKKIA